LARFTKANEKGPRLVRPERVRRFELRAVFCLPLFG
jgi:hypothetical protein